ncbi:AhpD family alkylhydroperoxidase [Pseudomonas sp. TE6288]|jgi:AhpD family alkylhydroperoxidase|uniref:Carboxymuconolactone decarboxylase family protein n=2 Tax=Pseudomonas TaxID=286 RepID=A0A2V4IBQ0_9PSED|nr:MULTISPECIES: carboxymuconolactone decarboxylase family protein [Pseudomonas]KNX77485.1 alkylhydroperoxidase [Pseudomonas sp. 250J]MBC3438197.1 carboxymuconolactone decarboxylase family protein [Pseudomonas sp. BW16M2]MBI6953553.1 carboxymuconolactone decarboxylase family protein [Pseudomonas sp. CCOS 191]MCU7240016.1 carboxymuconolactone decarboxylase family protein [Pseudomonas peradeniyensis]MCU7280891.1 carboxymuconolactone decarboxylase family protein [Pseudomonas peradeniyensis]
MSMMDWDAYRKQLMAGIGDLKQLSPDTVAGYMTASGAGAKTNHLDAKTRELISLAVAVTTRCDGCIAVHSQQAVKHGATREEIAEALGVAVAMNAGAALVYSARALDAVGKAGA